MTHRPTLPTWVPNQTIRNERWRRSGHLGRRYLVHQSLWRRALGWLVCRVVSDDLLTWTLDARQVRHDPPSWAA